MTIGFRELYCVVVAVKTFASITANARVTLHVENEAVCFCVNNASSKNDYWMELIRELYYVLVHFNMECHAVHLYSQENVVADAISRLDFVKFRTSHPSAHINMYLPSDLICHLELL